MENKNLKEVDWGYIPNHWDVKTTEEITEFITDYVANGSFASLAENVNYKSLPDYAALIRLTDYNNNFKGDFVYVDKHAYDFLKKSKLEGGEVIISNVGAYAGTVFLAPKLDIPTTLGPNSIMMNFKTNNMFYYYWLKSLYGQHMLEGIISGSAQPKFNKTSFRKLEVPVPPLPEQKAIASVLSSLDDKIDLLHQQNQTLEALAETLFRQWFIEEAKEDWEDCTIEDLCIKINSGGTPSTKIDSYYNGNINWYSTKELNDNFLFSSNSKITQEGLDNSSAKIFPAGTVVIAIYAAPTVGRLGILTEDSAFNQAACGLVANDKICSKEFLYLYLKNQRVELNLMASGSAQQNLNVGKIKSYPCFIPDSITMEKFKFQVIPLFSKVLDNSKQIQTLTQLRDTLLPKLMSGEVRVKL